MAGSPAPAPRRSERRGLVVYFAVLGVTCAAFIAVALALGQTANAAAGLYMLTPALAATLARVLADPLRFRDAGLGLGRWRELLRAWLAGLAFAAVCALLFTLSGAVRWDFSGQGFLDFMDRFAPGQGQKMVAELPAGWTLPQMLSLFALGSLTIFNVPGILLGFGEEFGWRGYLFPRLYRIRPWLAIGVGGIVWFAWHTPLGLLLPASSSDLTAVGYLIQGVALAVGSICTGLVFAHAYAASGSIWVASLLHITCNNASRAFSFWVHMENQELANVMLVLVMVAWAAWLWRSGRLEALQRFAPAAESGTECVG